MSIQRHTSYNLLGSILPMALSLVTIPLYINLIGEARYGVLAVAWLLLGYFGLFDLGLGRATAQRVATLRDAHPQIRSTVVWTALGMNVSLGMLGGFLIWPVAAYFLRHVLDIDSVLRPELETAYLWLVVAVPMATLSGVLTGALEGQLKFLELNIISVFTALLVQLVPLAVAWGHGPDLAWLLPAAISVRLVTLALLYARCHIHVFKGFKLSLSKVEAKDLLQFGGWVTVTSLVGPFMAILDRFLVGIALGATAVTFYTVPFQLAERFSVLPGALVSALFPRLAGVGVTKAKQLTATATRSLAVVMTPLMLAGILLVEPFLQWWLSPAFASQASLTAKFLILGFWINAFAHIPYAQLQAAGKPDVVAKCHLAELTPYLLLLYIALFYWGLPGAATVFGIRALADCLLLWRFAGMLRTGIFTLWEPAAILLCGLLFDVFPNIEHAIGWSARLGLLAVSLLWAWRNAPKEIRLLVTHLLSKLPLPKREP